jgi:SAM-dependent methyltransferase
MTLSRYLTKAYYELLKIDPIRNYYCWLRFRFMERRMRTVPGGSGVGATTIEHNKAALRSRAGFGMGNRMAMLLYPLAALLRLRPDARVLIVGPRTEDDIFWARALGLKNVRGLDLFSYSSRIDVGDMHQTDYESGSFDAVILGWVISYSSEPERLVAECKRLTAPGGYIGFGIESNPTQRATGTYAPPRVNRLNSAHDIAALVQMPIAFVHDPAVNVPTDNAVIFQAP